MAYRVAAASSDGKVINQHFGRSGQFLVFDIRSDGGFDFVELRKNIPPCGTAEHDENAMTRSVELLFDCKMVVSCQIGPGAEQALGYRGIRALTAAGFIDEVLEKLASSYLVREYFK